MPPVFISVFKPQADSIKRPAPHVHRNRTVFRIVPHNAPATVAPGGGGRNALCQMRARGAPSSARLRGRRFPPRLRHVAGHEVAPAAVGERLRLGDPSSDLGAHPAFGTPLFVDPFLAPGALGHPARRLLRPEPVHHQDQRAVTASAKGRVEGGAGGRRRATGPRSGKPGPAAAD